MTTRMPTTGQRAVKFATQCLYYAFEGGDMSGADIQELAEECGLIRKVKFNPKKHKAGGLDVVRGDDWYEFSRGMKLAKIIPGTLTEWQDIATAPRDSK